MKTLRNVVTMVILMLAIICNVNVAFAAEEEHEVINFTLSEEGVLTANQEFEITTWRDGEHLYSSQNDDGTYSIDYVYSYEYYICEDFDCDGIEWFQCNDTWYGFNLDFIKQSWGYATSESLEVIPTKAVNLMKKFNHTVVVECYEGEEDSTTMAMTNFDHYLITEDGVIDNFIIIEINSNYIEDDYKMESVVLHELGHAIIADIILNKYDSAEAQTFVWDSGIIVTDIIEETIEKHFDGDYGIIYDSISKYAKTAICEIPSEALMAYMSKVNTSTFNEKFVETMLKTWEETKK